MTHTEERARSYVVRDTLPVGADARLLRDETQYDRHGVAIDYCAGCCVVVLGYTNAGFSGILARVGMMTDKGDVEFTVSAGALAPLGGAAS